MTPTTLAHLRAVAAGFRGRFFFDAERGDLAYIAKACDDKQCECERKTNSDGDQDCSVCIGDMDHGADTGEPIAEMLNALPAALDEVERLRALLREALEIGEKHITNDNSALTDESLTRLAELRREGGV